MKTDRLLTLAALVLICVICGHLFSRSVISGSWKTKPSAKSTGFTTNYASSYLGATLTDFSHACKGASSVLNDDTEKYMICFCEAKRKMFTVQLLREIEVRIVTLTNLEHFSSGVRNFTLLGSNKYPTKAWMMLGSFEAGPWRGTQQFEVTAQKPVRFLRFMWATSHGDDSWCTLTNFKVFGVDVLETLTEDYSMEPEVEEPPRQSVQSPALTLSVLPPSLGGSAAHHIGIPGGGDQLSYNGEVKIAEEKTLLDLIDEAETIATGICGHRGGGDCRREKNDKTVVNSDCVSSPSCTLTWMVNKNSMKCLPHQNNTHALHSTCSCLPETVVVSGTTPPSKPSQRGTALHILLQMNKQLKALQQGLEEARRWEGEMQIKLEQMGNKLHLIGTRLRNRLLADGDYREKVLKMKEEVELMKSRQEMRLERGHEESNEILKVWVVCSNILALIAMIIACFTVHSSIPGGAHRFSFSGSSSPLSST